jgi:hypothetical protein
LWAMISTYLAIGESNAVALRSVFGIPVTMPDYTGFSSQKITGLFRLDSLPFVVFRNRMERPKILGDCELEGTVSPVVLHHHS